MPDPTHTLWLRCLTAMFMLPLSTLAQPFAIPTPAGTTPSEFGHRHPIMPTWAELNDMALDAEDAMLPPHGGLDERGRPAWTHQVRRRSASDPTQWFNGWVKLYYTFPTQGWRFQRFESGWLREQVGFYANGMPEQHFHRSAEGRNVGSQRMWFEDGSPYLDQYHDEEGQLHGWQRRWTTEGQWDWSAQYDHGIELDAQGRPVPGSKQAPPSGAGGC